MTQATDTQTQVSMTLEEAVEIVKGDGQVVLHKGNIVPFATRLIPLTKGLTAIVDEDDYTFLNSFKWCASNSGSSHYAQTRTKDGLVFMHHLVAGMALVGMIDHLDQNTMNNTKANLRVVTASVNQQNHKMQKNNTTGYYGVTFDKVNKKYRAMIHVNSKAIPLGRHQTAIDAALDYDAAALTHFGPNARLNFPKGEWEVYWDAFPGIRFKVSNMTEAHVIDYAEFIKLSYR